MLVVKSKIIKTVMCIIAGKTFLLWPLFSYTLMFVLAGSVRRVIMHTLLTTAQDFSLPTSE